MLRKEKEKVGKVKIVLFTYGDINLEVKSRIGNSMVDTETNGRII